MCCLSLRRYKVRFPAGKMTERVKTLASKPDNLSLRPCGGGRWEPTHTGSPPVSTCVPEHRCPTHNRWIYKKIKIIKPQQGMHLHSADWFFFLTFFGPNIHKDVEWWNRWNIYPVTEGVCSGIRKYLKDRDSIPGGNPSLWSSCHGCQYV